MKKNLTSLLVILVVVALAIGAVVLRKYRSTAVTELGTAGDIPWALHTAKVHSGSLSRGFPALASLSGSTEITISSQISGSIEVMGPREGVAVKKEDMLARISVAELQQQKGGIEAQREAALAQRNRTRDEYKRQLELKNKGLTTQELVDAKNAAAIAADKQVSNIDRQIAAVNVRIGYGAVYAPQDAVVAARLMEPGDVAQPGKPLYRLTVDSAARLRVNLPQQILEQVQPGTKVILEHGSLHQAVQLSRIFPALDNHALGAAEADLPTMPFNLPSGARIPAQVILQTVQNAVSIPHRALVRTGNKGFLFKVVTTGGEAKLQRLSVEILLEARESLAVAGDLHAGDQVVVAHQSVLMQLRDGDPATIRAESPAEKAGL